MKDSICRHTFSLTFLMVVVLILLAGTGDLHAQATADVNGRVQDQQGAFVPGVNLTLRGQDTGLFRTTVSSENGAFNFTGMVPGVYQIEAELTSFKKYQRSNMRLEVGKTVEVDIVLEVGGLAESVTVIGEAMLVDTTSKEVGGFVETRELLDLPTTTRNFTSYLAVLPGVVSGAVGGQPGNTVNYTFDGGSNNDVTRGGDQARVPIEAIAEFELMVGQADAAYGTTGAVVNAASKHGTNQFHGSLLTLIRDSSLARKSYFARVQNLPKPKDTEKQFAAALGGPIIQNKAHFFATYEQFLRRRAVIVNIPDRPDLAGTLEFPGTLYNNFVRFDHQINSNHTWGVKWVSEYFPNLNTATRMSAARTAEDHDQQVVVDLTSVLSPTMLNVVRFGNTREDYTDSSYAFKDAGRRQEKLLPTLNFQSFTDQQNAKGDSVGEHLYLLSDTLSWFVPDAKGSHSFQTGVEFSYTSVYNHVQDNLNGTFSFSHNGPFNAADPRSWPDQFSIRVPIELIRIDRHKYASGYLQDKWKLSKHLSLNLGLRYELEVIPVTEKNNPKFTDPSEYPIDKNNFAPRLGFSLALGDSGHSVVRGAWGMYFQRTLFGTTSAFESSGVYSTSFTATFPANNRDPGPSKGQFPTEPMLLTYPVVNRALVNQLFPAGTLGKNVGTVRLDDPSRSNPYTHQISFGYQQQLGSSFSLTVDYLGKRIRDLLVQKDLNPGLRVDTSRTGRVNRVDPNFTSSVFTSLNLGQQTFDSLMVEVQKRFSRGYSYRVAYTLGKGTGNISSNNSSSPLQLLDDLRLDLNQQPTSVDRRHNFVISGTLNVPYTGGMKMSSIARYTSGAPFTISDSSSDPDRNGILNDPLPAGAYSGTGDQAITVENKGGISGALLPGSFNLDTRLGYNFSLKEEMKLEVYADILNVTDFNNWSGISGDRRVSNFLRPTGTSGQTRTLQIGARFAF